jgi:hypothetical protein
MLKQIRGHWYKPPYPFFSVIIWWFRPSLVSIGLVLSEEKIFEKVYDVRRTPSDGNSSDDPLGQVS